MHRILQAQSIGGHRVNVNMIVLFINILQFHSIDEIFYLQFKRKCFSELKVDGISIKIELHTLRNASDRVEKKHQE
jgi:hypothetical protein